MRRSHEAERYAELESLYVPGAYQESRPSRRLAPYVECYWWREGFDGAHCQRVLPDGCVDILFAASEGEPFGLSVVGLMTRSVSVPVKAGQSFFGIRFRPGMAAEFLEGVGLLNDRSEPLESIWGATALLIGERLSESRTAADKVVVFEEILRPPELPDAVRRALWRLSMSRASLGRIATDAGISPRTLRRVCVERTGIAPKYLRRILRFRRTVDCIRAASKRGGRPNCAQLALACGYYDQAHFIHEFQEFSGSTPGRFLQS